MSINTISVIGLGYIGLPTAAIFASRKKHVIGVDVNQDVIDAINAGKIHFVEPELDTIVSNVVKEEYLRAVSVPEPADVFFIAVPTPFLPLKSGEAIYQPDLKFIESAVRGISNVLKKGDLIVLESTSPVGTTEKMAAWLSDLRPDLTFPQTHGEESDIRVAYCPERVLPGQVIKELVENDRVIGGMTQRCSDAAILAYKIFVKGKCLVSNSRTAEMVKLTENASRDVNIAFANELSIICDKLNINVWEMIALSNHHPRVDILEPGPGVGGHCIAVDPWFIISKTPDQASLIKAAREVNQNKPDWVVEKVKLALAEYLSERPDKKAKDVSIACFGLAFKADIDDLRESPAVSISLRINEFHSGKFLVIEPNINELPDYLQNKFLLTSFNGVDAVNANIKVLLVDHQEFKEIKIDANDKVVDTRGIWQ